MRLQAERRQAWALVALGMELLNLLLEGLNGGEGIVERLLRAVPFVLCMELVPASGVVQGGMLPREVVVRRRR